MAIYTHILYSSYREYFKHLNHVLGNLVLLSMSAYIYIYMYIDTHLYLYELVHTTSMYTMNLMLHVDASRLHQKSRLRFA